MVGHKSVGSRLFVSVALLVGALTGCGGLLGGTGNLVEENRQPADFNRIGVGQGIPLYVTVGEAKGVRITGDEDLVARMVTEVDASGTLVIQIPEDVSTWSSREGLLVEVKVPHLESVSRSGGGPLSIHGLDSDTFTLTASGGGGVVLRGAATTFTTDLSGGTTLQAREFLTQDAHLTSSGGGSTVVRVSDSLRVTASGGGQILIHGAPSVLSKELSGGSTLTFE